ncbi:hypothetical protein H0H81_003651 [Sphagnurus paluster]|uniref:Protein kinase domain-containing protein n=1 Tax=Sphagnurus paluster TaxID=117069 RepID=A0A9P7KH93_9AGAR|nr:hypothetical protein H0H81_003651 [Sphagnurus paluster]
MCDRIILVEDDEARTLRNDRLKRDIPDDFEVEGNKGPKCPKTGANETTKPKVKSKQPVVQTASYGAEVVCRRVYATHAITVSIEVSHSLVPLSKRGVEKSAFVGFWVELYQCHRMLWINGIEHRDISMSNLMYHEDEGKAVLNDFDLAVYRSSYVQPGGERTGTIPCMALDLLHKRYFYGKVQRRYRHDLESFVWVLVVNTLEKATNLDDSEPYDIEPWINSSQYNIVGHLKLELQQAWRTFPKTLAGTDEHQWKLTKALLKWLAKSQLRRLRREQDMDDSDVEDLGDTVLDIEDSDNTVLGQFEKTVAQNWPKPGETNWPIFMPMGDAGKADSAVTAEEK